MCQTFIINNDKPSIYVNELMNVESTKGGGLKSWLVQGAQNPYDTHGAHHSQNILHLM